MRLTRLRLPRWRRNAAAVARDRRGLAMTEFALILPVISMLGLYGLELCNLALAHLRISQIASNLADTASRVGESSGLAKKVIREADINDAFQAVRLQGASRAVTDRGRITLSSLERNADGGQWIHWQRCIGKETDPTFASSAVAGTGATGTALVGMGPSGEEIKAPVNSAVMFAEVTYRYKPLITSTFVGSPVIKARAAFLVREARDLDEGDNPANPAPNASPSSCSTYAA